MTVPASHLHPDLPCETTRVRRGEAPLGHLLGLVLSISMMGCPRVTPRAVPEPDPAEAAHALRNDADVLPEGEPIEQLDQAIEKLIRRELLFDPTIRTREVTIHVRHAAVTLEGTVENLLAQRRAAQLAEGVPGVRAVVNRLTVRPVQTRDISIQRDVVRALRFDPATLVSDIDVSVSQRVVTLQGTVASRLEWERAEELAESIRGVVDVKNQLEIRPTLPPMESSQDTRRE